MFSALISAFHLLGLALALGSVFARGRAFRAARDGEGDLSAVFFADNIWGVSAVLVVASGLIRLLGEHEKGVNFFLYNGFFWTKMALFGAVFALELWPMITLIRWRILKARGAPVDHSRVATFALINRLQLVLVTAVVFAAAAMARGLWLFS